MDRNEWIRQKVPLPLSVLLGAAWRMGARARAQRPYKGSSLSPVVAVGNLQVGGTGKTPFSLWLLKAASDAGLRGAVLSRGYGRKGSGTLVVEPSTLPELAGDEPLLFARAGFAVVVGGNRVAAADLLAGKEQGNYDFILLDDGLQQRALKPDLRICLWDPARAGSQHCLPRGILREDISNAASMDMFLWRTDTGPENKVSQELKKMLVEHQIPCFQCGWKDAQLQVLNGVMPEPPARILVAAGVGRPQGVAEAIHKLGFISTVAELRDHDEWGQSTIDKIRRQLRESDSAGLVITAKDEVKRNDWDHLFDLPVAVVRNRLQPNAQEDADTIVNSLVNLVRNKKDSNG